MLDSKAYLVLQSASLIFWDFDGVIKDSVEVKSLAFEKLFISKGSLFVQRVREHHLVHGGVSRYEKIKIYLSWLGQSPSEKEVEEYAHRFSQLVFRAVIESAWIPGVHEYLSKYHSKQIFVLVTATPQIEIELILKELKIESFFKWIYGSPVKKDHAIKEVLTNTKILTEKAIMVGDSLTDYEAAVKTEVAFVLRTASYNLQLQEKFQGTTFKIL